MYHGDSSDLYFNVNVYLKEIPCLNKVTLPYLTLYRKTRFITLELIYLRINEGAYMQGGW